MKKNGSAKVFPIPHISTAPSCRAEVLCVTVIWCCGWAESAETKPSQLPVGTFPEVKFKSAGGFYFTK